MPKIDVQKSVRISKPAEEVFAIVSNLGRWRPWNPWLVTEPEAHVEIEPGGKQYRWQGRRTGSGEMKITSEESPTRVDLDLTFLEPFKSHAKVRFDVEPNGDGCTVSWTMHSSLPFFLFFMRKMMSTMIGMDFERGLSMLADYAETGAVPSKIEVKGETTFPGCQYVGITTECALDELGPKMTADLKRLQEWQRDAGVEIAGDVFSTYRRWDLSAGRVRYTTGIPVDSLPDSLPDRLEVGRIPRLKTYVLDHVGTYRHLGNAWSAGMQMGRSKEFRTSKAHPPFETYPVAPDGSLHAGESDAATRTSLHFAVR